MPSKTMLERLARLEAEEKKANSQQKSTDNRKPEIKQPDESNDGTDEIDPSNLSDDGFVPNGSASHNEQNHSDENEHEDGDDEDDSEVDYKNKFNRVAGKVSSLEKTKAEQAKEIERLKAELESKQNSSDNQQGSGQSNKRQKSKPASTEAVTDEEVEDYLVETFGDDYEFMDSASKRREKITAKKLLTLERQLESGTVDKVVNKKFEEQKLSKRINAYTKEMDSFIKSIDPDSDFTQVINEPAFDEYLQKNRKKRAIFIEASRDFDDESKELVKEVISGYLGRDYNSKPKNTSPNVNSRGKPQGKKKPAISQERIDKAYKDLKIPSRRAEAVKLLKRAEELGLD